MAAWGVLIRYYARQLHGWLALIVCMSLFISALTGMTYRILRTCGVGKHHVEWLMDVHSVSVWGAWGSEVHDTWIRMHMLIAPCLML